MNTGNALVLKNVSKQFSGFKLKVDFLELPRGSIMGLVGPNGAGKSTLIKMIMNLVHPDRGEISVLGRDYLQQENEVKNLVGYVPEECRVYEEVTPVWAGWFVAHYYTTWDHGYYEELLQRLRLPVNKKVKELSRGNKMKLSLALALAHRPELLLLDEPTSGLDPVARHELLQDLLEVIQDENRSVLFSSHIVGDIEKVADYVAFLRQGRLILNDNKEDIMEGWKRVQVRLPAESGAAEKIKNLFVQSKCEGRSCQGITAGYNGAFVQELENLGAENIRATPLALEEIMITLSREEV